jgi:hypothetical protein
MPTHLPAFQFYPGDWRKDPAIQMLDYFDRGVWFELLCFMHEAEERGKLKVNGRWLDDEKIARMLGIGSREWKQTRSNLEAAGVPGVDGKTKGIFSKRMVRDEAKRLAKVEAGRLGGKKSRPRTTSKQTTSKTEPSSGTTSEAKRGSSVSVAVSKEKKYQKKKEAESVENSPPYWSKTSPEQPDDLPDLERRK